MEESRPQLGGDAAAGAVLLLSIFILAVCGLVYELVAGTLSSYLLGDSVTQFSLTIGLFLTAMGVGSWLSRYIVGETLACLIALETLVGLIGGTLALFGYMAFTFTALYVPVLYGGLFVLGTLIGMEIPITIRILRELDSLRVTVANVLSVDYVGAFIASILFPFLLVPHLGIVRAGLVMGLANILVSGLLLWKLGGGLGAWRLRLTKMIAGSWVALVAGLVFAGQLVSAMENELYQDEILLAKSTPYQRMVVTRWDEDIRLFLNGHLQFSAVDEYRYHEALIHPAMTLAASHEKVLVLGGGDGLATREILKYPDTQRIDLVDLDPEVTTLFRDNPLMAGLNEGSLSNPRVHIHNMDAMRFLEESTDIYDVIVMDLPDPSEPTLGKLYSTSFYKLAGKRLSGGGMMVTQATSPFRARQAFWCIAHTIEAARWGPEHQFQFQILPYQVEVPTFGTWGFVLAGYAAPDPQRFRADIDMRFLTPDVFRSLLTFAPDVAEVETGVTTLDDPVVFELYGHGYHKYLY